MSAELDLDDVASQSKRALRELTLLRKDAERYRWLRMNRLWVKANLPFVHAGKVDEAIDAAMAAASAGADAP